MLQTVQFTAGQQKDFTERADFFRILAADFPCDVYFYWQGAEVARAEGVGEGYAEDFLEDRFDKVSIISSEAQAVQFVTRDGNRVEYDKPPTGNVEIINTGGAFTQAQATVTNASGQLLAAKLNRRYLLIQNNDASADMFVTLDGTAATAAKGIKLSPGASMELANFCPTGAINAIGSTASNANVVVVEG